MNLLRWFVIWRFYGCFLIDSVLFEFNLMLTQILVVAFCNLYGVFWLTMLNSCRCLLHCTLHFTSQLTGECADCLLVVCKGSKKGQASECSHKFENVLIKFYWLRQSLTKFFESMYYVHNYGSVVHMGSCAPPDF